MEGNVNVHGSPLGLYALHICFDAFFSDLVYFYRVILTDFKCKPISSPSYLLKS